MTIEWKTFDGEQRIAHAWKKKGSKAAVACIHGMGGSGEEFHPLPHKIDDCSFYALELRGQGCDPVKSRRGVVLDLESQINDIGAFLKAIRMEHPAEPVFLMGESMGALLSAAYMARAAREDMGTVPNGLIL